MIPSDRKDADALEIAYSGPCEVPGWVKGIAERLFDGERRGVRHKGVHATFLRRGNKVSVLFDTYEEAACTNG